MESPRVSVIMTVYNGEKYVQEAVESIRRQSLSDFELVIVDDGSSDATLHVLTQAARADPRIRVLANPHVGRARALNLAWRSATGAHIANMDADDLAGPLRLEKQLAYFGEHPELGLLGTGWYILDNQIGQFIQKCPPLDDHELHKKLIRHLQFYHSSVMIPRRVLEEIGGYDERLRLALDYDLCVRIAARYKVANLPDFLVTQRIHLSAFFQRIHGWPRYKTVVRIRWFAWRRFDGSLADLPHVLDPIGCLPPAMERAASASMRRLRTLIGRNHR